ncbi:MAG: hypothetical protein K1X72_28615 [Pyrinomonadaceae bacterium]|nr:hypothetical protein [Pyrinomonadaceae bacterium]
MPELIKLDEPPLLFGYNQTLEDPRDGLTLFNPLDEGSVYGVRAGVIGTPEGIERYKRWVESIQQPIFELDSNKNETKEHRPLYPGFEAAFGIEWKAKPVLELTISPEKINQTIYIKDQHQRVFKTVDLFARRILKAKSEEDAHVDIWFVVIPDSIYKYCRPKSEVEVALVVPSNEKMTLKRAKELQRSPSLFEEENDLTVPYQYEVNFHNQLKARLLPDKILTQIVRETTLCPEDFLKSNGKPIRPLGDLSAVAWRLSTGVFYKVGGRPWKIDSVREGVCYIGLVFKEDLTSADPCSACCAAQMFLDSGDGIVFKGNVGPWRVPGTGDFHLKPKAAEQLIDQAVNSYRDKFGEPPRELFIHGKVNFNDEEWSGFTKAVDTKKTNLVGVQIYAENHFKLFRKKTRPVLRGTAYIRNNFSAYLWTKGFIPRLQTYPGRGVPKPLAINIRRGEVSMRTVLQDILALTKLNYNTCMLADGQPVTLKFADAVGEILTAGPLTEIPPLPFKHYI